MQPVSALPGEVWGTIVDFTDASSLVTLKQVSKNMRVLVKMTLQKRWDVWRSEAARSTKMSRELGGELDNHLFKELCSGKNNIIFTALDDKERSWMHVR